MNQEKIGKFISTLRKEKKMTQQELAEALGVSDKSISRWENGKTMPDVSLFKPICQIFNISVDELVNGKRDDEKQNSDNTIINIIDFNQKSKKKMHRIIGILILIIILIIISFIITTALLEKNKYPQIDIYNLRVLENNQNTINSKMTIAEDDYKIYFYGIDSLQLSDSKGNYYDFRNALKNNQIVGSDLRKYLESQFSNDNIMRYYLYDGGTAIYKHKNYAVIFCNTIDGNKDIYIGTSDIENGLKGEYCGHSKDATCYFTRTYHIVNILEDDDYDYVNVTLKEFQGATALVKINRSNLLETGKDYEFTFFTYESFPDTINNIFEKATISSIKETTKTGLDQINEKICITK